MQLLFKAVAATATVKVISRIDSAPTLFPTSFPSRWIINGQKIPNSATKPNRYTDKEIIVPVVVPLCLRESACMSESSWKQKWLSYESSLDI